MIRMYVCTYVCMYVCMYVCTYICVCVCVCVYTLCIYKRDTRQTSYDVIRGRCLYLNTRMSPLLKQTHNLQTISHFQNKEVLVWLLHP